MELLTVLETEKHIEEIALSEYQLERGKPMPNLTHGSLQANLIIQIAVKYGSEYRIASEVALATQPTGTTPDIVLYPNRDLNFINEISKQTDAPLLAIEIQSPSQSIDEMIDKAIQFFAFGVKSCWVVVPAMKGIAVYADAEHYQFFQHDDILKDATLNIEIELNKVFV